MSASLCGKMVPCQAGRVGGTCGVARAAAAILLSCKGSGRSTTAGDESEAEAATANRSLRLLPGTPGGGVACNIVQGLLTRGFISGNCWRSWKVGIQVRPSGGPKSAQVFNSRARSLVVNLASTEW